MSLRPGKAGGRRRTALWASTSLETRGGVSSFVRGMSTTPLWTEWNIRHVATHRDGTTLAKIAQFVVSLPRFVYYVVHDRPAVVHLHVASYGSFVRKFTLSLIARAFGVPVLAHIHGAQFDVFYADTPKIVQKAIRHMLGHSSAVVALGNDMGRAFDCHCSRAPKFSSYLTPHDQRRPWTSRRNANQSECCSSAGSRNEKERSV